MTTPPKALIIGYPVAQARSPLIHQYWLRELGLAGSYEREAVPPEDVAQFLRDLPARGIAGCNVTVPNKEEAFRACAVTTNAARMLGAANTLWFEDGKLHGDNTDGSGFVAHLDDTIPGWAEPSPRILVLGAGGAARGIIPALLPKTPAEILVTNRNPERAEALVRDLRMLVPDAPVRTIAWDARSESLGSVDVLINTTSLGMTGKPALEIDLSRLPERAIVADIVYVPLETPLLAQARARNLRTVDGLGMLLHQAVPGFTRWFGKAPKVTPELRAYIVADLLK